jgi:Bax protein
MKTLNLSHMTRECVTLIICFAVLLLLPSCSKPIFPFGQEKPEMKQDSKASDSSGEKARLKRAEKSKAIKAPDVTQKKVTFFSFMKPLVEMENTRIMQQRTKLETLRSAGRLNKTDLQWLHQLARQYRISFKGDPDESIWNKLMQSVDIIPLEMALVQAANESAWGQSRFARDANNYFGQWCYEKGCGLVPLKRTAGATHEVKSFATANLSVRAYMKNINTSRAYAEFRDIRRDLRHQHRTLDAELLAMGLKSYSERGMAYVKVIQAMIRSNRKLIQSA